MINPNRYQKGQHSEPTYNYLHWTPKESPSGRQLHTPWTINNPQTIDPGNQHNPIYTDPKARYVCLTDRYEKREPQVVSRLVGNQIAQTHNLYGSQCVKQQNNDMDRPGMVRHLMSPERVRSQNQSKFISDRYLFSGHTPVYSRKSSQQGINSKDQLKDLRFGNQMYTQSRVTPRLSPSNGVIIEANYYISDMVVGSTIKPSLTYEHFCNCFKLTKSCQRLVPSSDIRQACLPQDQFFKNKKTLVFDMDQTLIHCTKTSQPPYDVKLTIQQPNRLPSETGFNIRPHVVEVLENLSKHFQLIVFTASHSFYANPVLDYLDPQHKLFQHRLFRQHCQQPSKGCFVKDLRVIPRQLSNMVLIDNSSLSYCFQPDNGVPIVSYLEGKQDSQLKKLQSYLMKLRHLSDVRTLNRMMFKTSEWYRFNSSEQAIRELFITI